MKPIRDQALRVMVNALETSALTWIWRVPVERDREAKPVEHAAPKFRLGRGETLLAALNALHPRMRWGAWVFAAGGALWALKVAFIALNDTMGRDEGALPVPVLYLSAVVLMPAGAAAIGMALLRRFPWWVQLLGAITALVALFLLYTVLDEVLKRAFEGVGPSWLHEELGIFATGATCLVGGTLLAGRIFPR